MKLKLPYVRLRHILTGVSILCLFIAIVLLFREIVLNEKRQNVVSAPTEVSHRILFISSYNPLYFTYESQSEGLSEGLYPYGIEYDVIYMDANRYGSKEDFLAFHDLLKAHLSKGNEYEAILAGDDAALLFVLEYQAELFQDLPVIFFGINDLSLAEQAVQNPYMTGFSENDYFEATLSLAGKLFPEAKQFVALHDDSVAGAADAAVFYSCSKAYPDCSFTELNTSSMTEEELIEALENIPSDAVLFYMTAYSDKSGKVYSMLNRTHTVVSHTSCPIFRNYVGGEGMGILGGTYMDFTSQCRMAGETVRDVLNGSDISKIPLNTYTGSRTVFDFQLLESYGLGTDLLPRNTIYYNQPETFLDRYRYILPPVFLILLALLLLVMNANLGTRFVTRTNEELKQSKDHLEQSQKELKYQAEHDDFLDILNRRTATEYLRVRLSAEYSYSIAMIDIDGFKTVNENYGHKASDDILKYLAASLKELAGQKHWLIARYGGDEFLLLIPDEILTVESQTTQEILAMFRSDIPVGDETINLSASIGISTSDGITLPDQHIINAEIAMYEAKARGRNGAFVYNDEMKKIVREENRIKGKLVEAFEQDGFYMLYQPQINARTKEVSGYEALVRMKTPNMYPGQFIPVAEKNGWIWKIGRITTELVVRQLAAWQANGLPLRPVSVNFSSKQLNDTGYIEYVQELLHTYHVPAQFLEIEITEGVFLERTAQAQMLFDRFKKLGIRLLMDDFGTGYSSLGYLTYIPVDVIKLDKSLVDAYLTNGKDTFIRDVILLVHDLHKEIIIEGVEEEWQFLRLQEFGADTIQGYFFSKPLPAEEAIQFKVKNN